MFITPWKETEERFQNLSFLKLTQIFFGLPLRGNANAFVLRRINSRLLDKEDPKSIVSLMRLIDKIQRDDEAKLRYGKTLDLVAVHFNKNSNVDIGQLDISTQTRLLKVYTNNAYIGGSGNTQLILKILKSLSDDLSSL